VSKVYIYVVRYDFGFAPNPFGGVCTLACCMPVIRRTACQGDWLIGMGGRDLKATGRCVYAMRVTGEMTFNQYWESDQYRGKRPVRNGSPKKMVGDNVYHSDPETGAWLQENCVHSQPSGQQDQPNTLHDTGTDRVLISEEFYYFGADAPEVPPKLLEQIGYRNWRGHRVYQQEQCQKLLNWIARAAAGRKNHVLGDPFQYRMSDKRYSRTQNKLI
jgi:hypothetical protein